MPASLAPTSDFAGTYVASTLIRSGEPSKIYDTAAERQVLVAERGAGEPRQHPIREPTGSRGGDAAVDAPGRWCRVAHLVAAPARADGALAPPGGSLGSLAGSAATIAAGGDRAGCARRLRHRAAVPGGSVGRCLGPRAGCRVRPLAARQARRRRLRPRIHGGDRQTAAGDRDRGVHDRAARLARGRRGARGGRRDRRDRAHWRRTARAHLVHHRDRHAEQLTDRADAGHQRAVRLAPGSRARRVPAGGRRRDRGRGGGRVAGNASLIAGPISSSPRSAAPWRSRSSRRLICSGTT